MDISRAWFYAVASVTMLAAFSVYAVRLAKRRGSFAIDDITLLIAYVVGALNFALLLNAWSNGYGVRVLESQLAIQLVFSAQVTLHVLLGLTKISFIAILRRLMTSPRTRTRVFCDLLIGFCAAWTVVSSLLATVGCHPEQSGPGNCPASQARFVVATALEFILQLLCTFASITIVSKLGPDDRHRPWLYACCTLPVFNGGLYVTYTLLRLSTPPGSPPAIDCGLVKSIIVQHSLVCLALITATVIGIIGTGKSPGSASPYGTSKDRQGITRTDSAYVVDDLQRRNKACEDHPQDNQQADKVPTMHVEELLSGDYPNADPPRGLSIVAEDSTELAYGPESSQVYTTSQEEITKSLPLPYPLLQTASSAQMHSDFGPSPSSSPTRKHPFQSYSDHTEDASSGRLASETNLQGNMTRTRDKRSAIPSWISSFGQQRQGESSMKMVKLSPPHEGATVLTDNTTELDDFTSPSGPVLVPGSLSVPGQSPQTQHSNIGQTQRVSFSAQNPQPLLRGSITSTKHGSITSHPNGSLAPEYGRHGSNASSHRRHSSLRSGSFLLTNGKSRNSSVTSSAARSTYHRGASFSTTAGTSPMAQTPDTIPDDAPGHKSYFNDATSVQRTTRSRTSTGDSDVVPPFVRFTATSIRSGASTTGSPSESSLSGAMTPSSRLRSSSLARQKRNRTLSDLTAASRELAQRPDHSDDGAENMGATHRGRMTGKYHPLHHQQYQLLTTPRGRTATSAPQTGAAGTGAKRASSATTHTRATSAKVSASSRLRSSSAVTLTAAGTAHPGTEYGTPLTSPPSPSFADISLMMMSGGKTGANVGGTHNRLSAMSLNMGLLTHGNASGIWDGTVESASSSAGSVGGGGRSGSHALPGSVVIAIEDGVVVVRNDSREEQPLHRPLIPLPPPPLLPSTSRPSSMLMAAYPAGHRSSVWDGEVEDGNGGESFAALAAAMAGRPLGPAAEGEDLAFITASGDPADNGGQGGGGAGGRAGRGVDKDFVPRSASTGAIMAKKAELRVTKEVIGVPDPSDVVALTAVHGHLF